MKLNHVRSALFSLLFSFTATTTNAASSTSPDIPLGTPEGFTASTIDPAGNGRYCISGAVYDDSVPTMTAYALLVDATTHRVLWRLPIPLDRDFVGSNVDRCLSDGNAYYLLSEENSDNSPAVSQERVVINKVSAQGKLLRQQKIEAGLDEWSYFFDVGPSAITIGGGTSATLDHGGKFGNFLWQFDSNLARTRTTTLENGAFWLGSNAKLDGDHLLVSGQFMPNKGSSAGQEAYAVSKIDAGSSRYTWSKYLFPLDAQSVTSVFGPDGSTYVAALTGSDLAVSVVDRTGKNVNSFAVKKPLCEIKALALDGHALKAIGKSCTGKSTSVIVAIDLIGKTAAIVSQLNGEILAPRFDGQGWVGVVKTKGEQLVFRRIAQ
ncbi:hypothetical protein [Paraburkholderia bryophila]|uniref:Pyrroloquinoline-quinone binding quinoprotein n=1 Tax=Paraburkholderia bryophila TaxID=420952 RepID=A0A7Y9WLF3_9BURK|nr:hypothetical protein [Paraburkholderia bryophila]NYH23021.1 hypothetical protein [Paraburkholderia bryophila]